MAGQGAKRELRSAPVRLETHPNGMPHIRSTVATMARLAREGMQLYPLRNLATRITHDVPSKSPTRELRALYEWVRDNIRYRFDPVGIEWVQSPERTVKEGAGDCDDISTLLAALAGSLGHKWRFRTVGKAPDDQRHIQLQAWDGRRWLDLDPVLEPPQPTTAPRKDLGTFGLRAPGAQHIWSDGGVMLSGPTTRADRELWTWVPYYPQVPPLGGDQPPQGGQWPRIDTAYRSPDAPGYQHGQPIQVWLRRGTVDERNANHLGEIPYTHPTLGAGVLKKIKKVAKKAVVAPLAIAHKVTHTGPIAKAEKAAQRAVGKNLPILKPLIDVHNAIAGQTHKLVDKAVKRNTPKLSKISLPTTGLKSLPTNLTSLKSLNLSTIAKGIPSVASAALAVRAGGSSQPADFKTPRPELARKYPENARMLYDGNARVFRVFVPKADAGLSGWQPTISFSLGATTPLNANVVNAARRMEAAVNAFTKKNRRPPAVKLPEVQAFQQAEGNLTVDGLYGSNTKTAATYYLGHAAPACAPALNKPVTWRPPLAQQPAQLPVSPRPNVAAINAVRPTPKPKPAPSAASFPAPAGYVEVGQETQNPGLPPAGYTGPAAPPAPPVSGTPAQPGAPNGGAPTPPMVASTSNAPAVPPGVTIEADPAPIVTVTPDPNMISDTAPSSASMATPIAVTPTQVATPAQLSPSSAAPPLPFSPPSGTYQSSGGPITYGPAMPAESGSGDNTWLWLAIAYLYSTRNKRAA